MRRAPALVWMLAPLALWAAACSGGGGGGGGGAGPPPASGLSFTSSSTASVAENTTGAAYTGQVTGAAGATFSIVGGADNARFSINAGNGQLSFLAPPDFEDPADANRDNVYEVTIGATAGSASASLAVRVSVTDVAGRLASRRVASGLANPLYLVGLPDGSGRLLVVQKGGLVRLVDPRSGAIAAAPFLNVTGEVATPSEQGLLGLALAPDFQTSRTFYVYLTNIAGNIELRRYRTLVGSPLEADPASADVILTIPHPTFDNHNGGWMDFDANGLLLIAVGDGGGGGDPGNNGQTLTSLLGKLLRIDVRSDAFPGDPNRDYAIPSANPFASGGGAPEILAYGLRNPWRSSIDRTNGNLYIGDVGQDSREEVSLLRPSDRGLNFGWRILEGTFQFATGSTAGMTPPVLEYAHNTAPVNGRSITGGYVYRGAIAQLQGRYLFSDFISARIMAVPASSLTQGTTLQSAQFTDLTSQLAPDVGGIRGVASFGEDEFRNVYIVDFLDGELFRIVEVE